MTLLRTFCLFAVIACAGNCAAEPPPPEKAFRLPVLIDASYNWRAQPTRGWHGVDGMLRLRLDDLWLGQGAWHQVAVAGFFESGYAYDPNPTRAAVMLGYGWGKDFYDPGDANEWSVATDDGAFPLTRTPAISYGVQFLAGLHTSTATRGNDDHPRSADAMRLEVRGSAGVLPLQLETRVAVHFNLRNGRFLDGEFYTGVVIARPMLPFGIRVGWSYLFTERSGGGFFVIGAVFAF